MTRVYLYYGPLHINRSLYRLTKNVAECSRDSYMYKQVIEQSEYYDIVLPAQWYEYENIKGL